MKQRKRKKLMTILLAVSLLLPVLPGMGMEVHGAEPDVTKFATVEQLKSSFNLNGGTAGRLRFGAGDREWLIAGVDTNNNNTLALLSTSSFCSNSYGSDSKYSTSTVANLLSTYLIDAAYFSTAEQSYMAETTVSTLEYDQGDSEVPRTKTGKLYLPDAQNGREGDRDTTICVGTNNDIPIALSQLKSENGFTIISFWLRSPYHYFDDIALVALPGPHCYLAHVYYVFAVVPAFNLNLSSVLFTSAAPAASSERVLTLGDAMTLRYDAGTELGSAAINPAQTSVGVSGAPTGTYLVVQNDSGAWAKKVTGNTTVNAGEMGVGLQGVDGENRCHRENHKGGHGRAEKARR